VQSKKFSQMARGGVIAAIMAIAMVPGIAMASDAQHWEIATVTANLGNGWRASAENIARTSESRGFYELEQNVMVGHDLGPKGGPLGLVFYLGYTHDPQYAHGDFTVMEHRFRQQLGADRLLQLGTLRVSGRLRLEERWREGVQGMAWRLRPYVKATMPVVGKVALVASHESFVDLNRQSFQRLGGEERMRNAVGINIALNPRLVFEANYMNQHGFVPGGKDSNDNIATFEIKANF
jgi:hypothetical protein